MNVMLSRTKVERGEDPEGEGRHVGLGIRDLDPASRRSPAIRQFDAPRKLFLPSTRDWLLTTHCKPNRSWPPNSRREGFFRSFQATLILGSFCFPFYQNCKTAPVKLLPSPPTKLPGIAIFHLQASPSLPLQKKPSAPKIQPTFATSINYASTSAPVQSPVSTPANRIFGGLRMHREEEPI